MSQSDSQSISQSVREGGTPGAGVSELLSGWVCTRAGIYNYAYMHAKVYALDGICETGVSVSVALVLLF